MDVLNPRRILAVSLEDSSQHLSRVVKDLTDTTPELVNTTLAGTTHPLSLKTAYYTASVPIWLDLISDPSEWSATFLSPEAKEVLEVLGGVIVVFPLPVNVQSSEAKAARELIQHVGKVVKDGLGGWSWDGVGLCLGVGEIDDVDEWDGCAAECGLEFVQVRGKRSEARNEFGEKTGIPRALEALESNDWAKAGDDDLGSDFGDFEISAHSNENDELARPSDALSKDHDDDADPDPESLDFGFDPEDFSGLKRAIWNAGKEEEEEDGEGFMNAPAATGEPNEAVASYKRKDSAPLAAGQNEQQLDDQDIQKLEGMMRKLQAVRDMSAGLPDDQRKRMAAKAVGEVMKDL